MCNEANSRPRGFGYVLLSLLLVMVWAATIIYAQEPSPRRNVIHDRELRIAPGELVAQGINALPVGPLGLKTYRLEVVKLGEPIDLMVRGHRKRVESAFRLTITAESFRGEDVRIWIDDEPVSSAVTGRTEVTTIIFDRELLQEGASITVSRSQRVAGESRTTLPERLEFPQHWRAAFRPANDKKPTVRLHRIASSPALGNQPGVVIQLTGDATYPIRNQMLIVSIGEQEFRSCSPPANGDPHTLICHLSEEQFESLKEGDTIRAKYGRGPTVPSYQRFGRLQKSMLKN
jgi:hypothetical protein